MSKPASIPTAAELMNQNVKTVTPDMPIGQLVDFLLKHKVSCAPVVSSEEAPEVIGFISEADALEHFANDMFYGTPRPPETVGTCMKRHPVTVRGEIDAFTLSSLFVSHGYRHVPVVNENHRLLGLVSRRDILHSIREFLQKSSAEYDSEHFRPDLKKIINHRFIVSG